MPNIQDARPAREMVAVRPARPAREWITVAAPVAAPEPDLWPFWSQSYVTANIRTRNSRYLVMARGSFVHVIHETTGVVHSGVSMTLRNGSLVLLSESGNARLTTSRVQDVYVLEN